MAQTLPSVLGTLTEKQRSDTSWQPNRFDLNNGVHLSEVQQLIERGDVARVHDELMTQLAGLVDTLHPEKKYKDDMLAKLAEEHLQGKSPHLYGNWIYYPWSGRLVHVLPEDEYRLLRTSRNRNKITFEEQDILRGLRIGVVGLSIGHAAATTLTMEEIGGELFLADFDFLELSNMNRIRVGVQNLGVNKAIIAARDIFEINPYARVNIFPKGITEKNLAEFLAPGGRALDMVYEECDNLHVKVLVREKARQMRIPVLMETSDRGLMDIERFDREPGRPVFHGLIGETKAEQLKGLSTFEKVPYVLQIHNQEGISDRMAASMVDIETTLASWPQLASEVALGSALNTSLARRIALGHHNESGRYYVDLEDIVADGKGLEIGSSQSYDIQIVPESQGFDLPPLTPVTERIEKEHVRTLAAYAGMAFSGGNCQPWNFVYKGDELLCYHDPVRSKSFLDFRNRASYLAFGSLAENIDLASKAMGIHAEISTFPRADEPGLVCAVKLTPIVGKRPNRDPLVDHIATRVTNRRLGPRMRLPSFELEQLSRIAGEGGGRLQWLVEDDELEAISDLLAEGDLLRMTSKIMHGEMMHEMRWTPEEVESTRDGLDVATLEFTTTDLAGLNIIRSWKVMKATAQIGGGLGLKRPMRKCVAAASAVGLLTYPGFEPTSYFQGGRILQRIWLGLTARDIAFQPVTPFTYLSYRLEQAGGEGLSAKELKKSKALRGGYRKLFHVPADHCEPMLFRVARVGPPTARSLRRRVDDTLTFA